MNEKLETYSLAAIGLARGLFNVYLRPLPNDMLNWAASKLVQFDIDQEAIDNHIKDVSGQTAAIHYYSTREGETDGTTR